MANNSRRGFASMSPGERSRIASLGGKAAHAKGTAHEFDSDEARRAGKKGGKASGANRGRRWIPPAPKIPWSNQGIFFCPTLKSLSGFATAAGFAARAADASHMASIAAHGMTAFLAGPARLFRSEFMGCPFFVSGSAAARGNGSASLGIHGSESSFMNIIRGHRRMLPYYRSVMKAGLSCGRFFLDAIA